MKDTYRKISYRHRRWDRITKGHHESTSAIGHGRELTEKTWTDGVDYTKTFKNRLDLVVRSFERKVAYKDKTDRLISGGNWNRDIPKEESRSLKEIVPILASLAGDTDSTALEKLYGIKLFCIEGSQQLWGNFRYSMVLVDFSREMQHHTSSKGHLCNNKVIHISTSKQYRPD